MKIVFVFFIVLNAWVHSFAQENIPSDKEQLLKGEAVGQVSVAESNGLLSPRKILLYKEQLGLTKAQMKKLDEMLKNFLVSATVKGQEIIEAEEDLNNLFRSGTVVEKSMRMKLERIGKLRAELRFMHLQTYLKAKKILSTNQWERIKELRTSEFK